jgi:hypothetical protein
MALFRDDPDFAAGIGIAAQQFGLHPQFVEKDYWVTETLRVLATEFGGEFTFKGGTSLSKGEAREDARGDVSAGGRAPRA